MENEKIAEWKWFSIDFKDSLLGSHNFLPTFKAVIQKHCIYPKEQITIRKDGYDYKFVFDWQDENICGIEVYRRLTD